MVLQAVVQQVDVVLVVTRHGCEVSINNILIWVLMVIAIRVRAIA